jgi:hypothetical protein
MHPQVATFWTAVAIGGTSILGAFNHYRVYTETRTEFARIPVSGSGFMLSSIHVCFLLVMSLVVVVATLLGARKIQRQASLVFLFGAALFIVARLAMRLLNEVGFSSVLEIAWPIVAFCWYSLLIVGLRPNQPMEPTR